MKKKKIIVLSLIKKIKKDKINFFMLTEFIK